MSTLPDDVRPFFSGTNIAHMATLLPDGSPHSVPMWVDMEGERIAILTSPESRKGRNLDNDPRVAFSVTDRENWVAMAMVRGRVVDRVDGDAGWMIIDRIANKYIGQPYPLRTDRVVYLIEPESAFTFTAG
jgi:PPOX class probable F420-dependent enzyme